MIKLRILILEDYARFSRWAHCNYKGSYKIAAEGSEGRETDVKMQAEGRNRPCDVGPQQRNENRL